MPLVGSNATLSAALKAAQLADPDIGAVDGPALDALCDALAGAFLAHIVANAVITVTVATTGTAAAQAGGGTGTVG